MNNLAELLSSPPDEISELNGVDLVRQKVAKKTKRQKTKRQKTKRQKTKDKKTK